MAEREAAHRQAQEASALQAEVQVRNDQFSLAKRGQLLSGLISVAGIVSGTIIGVYGQPWLGTALGAGGLATVLISAFRRPQAGKPGTKEETGA